MKLPTKRPTKPPVLSEGGQRPSPYDRMRAAGLDHEQATSYLENRPPEEWEDIIEWAERDQANVDRTEGGAGYGPVKGWDAAW